MTSIVRTGRIAMFVRRVFRQRKARRGTIVVALVILPMLAVVLAGSAAPAFLVPLVPALFIVPLAYAANIIHEHFLDTAGSAPDEFQKLIIKRAEARAYRIIVVGLVALVGYLALAAYAPLPNVTLPLPGTPTELLHAAVVVALLALAARPVALAWIAPDLLEEQMLRAFGTRLESVFGPIPYPIPHANDSVPGTTLEPHAPKEERE